MKYTSVTRFPKKPCENMEIHAFSMTSWKLDAKAWVFTIFEGFLGKLGKSGRVSHPHPRKFRGHEVTAAQAGLSPVAVVLRKKLVRKTV